MAALEVAIGVVFYMVTLSLLCSTVAEWWSRKRDRRGALLEDGVRLLLGGGRVRSNEKGKLVKGGAGADGPAQPFLQAVLNHPLIRTQGSETFPESIESKNFARAVIAVAGGDTVISNLEAAKDAVEGIEESQLRKALLAMLNDDDKTIDDFQDRIASWFDDAMKQTTALYRRSMDVVVRWIAVFIVVALNADAVALIQVLWNDPALRESVVAAAEQAAGTAGEAQEIDEIITNATNELAPFPIGWPAFSEWSDDPRGFSSENFLLGLLTKAGGCVFTIIALSLGAPFWFDLLRQLLSLRRGGGVSASAAPGAASDA